MPNESKISLAAARVNAGLTQTELGDKIGVSRQTVANWETGATTPRIEKAQLIADVLNRSIDYINFNVNTTNGDIDGGNV